MKRVMTIFIFTLSLSNAYAGGPPNWPWHGVAVTSITAGPGDIALLKSRLGINSVRLTMDVRSYATKNGLSPDEAFAKNLAWVKAMLEACKSSNVTAIVSINQFPIDPSLGFNQESPEFWENQKMLDDVIRTVGLLASSLNGMGRELGAYEVLSEPVLRKNERALSPPQWPALISRLIAEIRRYDKERYIVIDPPPGALPVAYKSFEPIAGPFMVYGSHMYLPYEFTHQGIGGSRRGIAYPGFVSLRYLDKSRLKGYLSGLRDFQTRNNALVWIGEFSAVRWAAGSDQYLVDLVRIFDEYGWGWSYFGFKEYHGWNPDYDTTYSDDKPQDWKPHFVGLSSPRWKALDTMFHGDRKQ